jgi:hypothetical protein
MPLVKGQDMTPDAAIAAGLCPECGQDLKASNPIAHRRSHWKVQPPLDRRGNEARRRMALLDKFIVDNNVRTSNMPKPAAAAAAPLP